MIRFPRALSIALLLVLAACTTTTSSPSADATATPEPTPTASPEPTPSPSASETDSPDASPSSTPIEGAGGFTWESNAEADALFADRFDCQNLDDGYQVDFPAEWNTNAEFGRVPTVQLVRADGVRDRRPRPGAGRGRDRDLRDRRSRVNTFSRSLTRTAVSSA